MATTFNSILSFLKDVAPGIFGTYGTPAAPAIGDTDWSGVTAMGAAYNEASNVTDGQFLIGKTGVAAIANPSVAPVLTAGTSGTLLAGTYEVARTWPNAYGETQISPIASITFGSGTTNSINVAAVTPPAGITSVNTYMSDAAGSITLRFKTSNAGGSFTITSLPTGGAIVPPSSNTTASSNHPVKGTLTGSNGIAITNGPGTVAAALAVTGDISASGGVVTVGAVNGVAVTGTPTTGQVITATGTSAAHWANPAGGTTALTNAHVFVGNGSNVATDVAMSGDATIANTGAVTVSKINGVSVSGTPSTGQVPTATGTTTATWQTPSGGGGGGAFVGCRAYATTTQSVSFATDTILSLDAETFDTNTFHSTVTNNSRITIPTGQGGKYLIIGFVRLILGTGTRREGFIFLNGTTKINDVETAAASDTYNAMNLTMIYDLADGDFIELGCYHTAAGGLTTYSGTLPWLTIQKVG